MADEARPAARVLVVDRDTAETRALVEYLQQQERLAVLWVRDGEAAHTILRDPEEPLNAMVADLHAQRLDGLRLLAEGLKHHADLCVVLVSADAELEVVTAAIRGGAADFQARPLNLEKLAATLRQSISRQHLRTQVDQLTQRLSDRFGFERIAGRSRAVTELVERARQVAGTRASVLLQGETGTGKALLAQTIHRNSPLKDGPFVSLQCSGLAEAAVEEDLFGVAAKGAHAARPGRFDAAAGGTLFLDQVSDLPPRLQTRLQRAISAEGPVPRLVSACEMELREQVRRGKFRDDLFFELAASTLSVPSLRERREDMPVLTQSLLEELNREHNRQVTGVTRGCMDLLMRYSWPGNVSELKAVLEGVVVFVEGRRPLEAGDLPEFLRDRPPSAQDYRVRVGMSMAEVERRAIQETLEACGGKKPEAAKMLGIGLRTLYRKIKEYEV